MQARARRWLLVTSVLACGLALPALARAEKKPAPTASAKPVNKALSKEALYKFLSKSARDKSTGGPLFGNLAATSRGLDWKGAQSKKFVGNLRQLEVKGGPDTYLVRGLSGEIYILWVPADSAALKKGAKGPYADFKSKIGNKMSFDGQVITRTVGGVRYRFLKINQVPKRLLLDRLFFIAIIILLFMTMVGMGLTLTLSDFAIVFKKPTGMVIGILCQFGLLPLVAYGVGRMFGYYHTYPFIFLGLILVASSPGGVTSNLMTYLGKGDVALSVSLTAVCTVAALVFAPLLLSLYGGNIPDFTIPVMAVFKQILVLVIVPLFVGMLVRGKWETLAKKLEKPFAMIGVFALLFLIVMGVWSNLEKFSDTNRYGVKFYATVFLLTFTGMLLSGLIAKLLRVTNFQIRAISLECGLRNASLAMTIAILLQDRIGDFYSSMFFTSGIFGLWMYAAGALSIWLYRYALPVPPKVDADEATG